MGRENWDRIERMKDGGGSPPLDHRRISLQVTTTVVFNGDFGDINPRLQELLIQRLEQSEKERIAWEKRVQANARRRARRKARAKK